MNIKEVAKLCHEVNAQYCAAIGDNNQTNWEDAPDWQKLSIIKGVEYHFENHNSTPADSHNSWLKEKEETGWRYGEVKDPEAKTHPCFVPFDELPAEQQAKDYIFRSIVHTLRPIITREDYESFGKDLVGISFNPDNTQLVNVIKSKFAEIIDTINDFNDNREGNRNTQRLFSHALMTCLDAQMLCVKLLFYKG